MESRHADKLAGRWAGEEAEGAAGAQKGVLPIAAEALAETPGPRTKAVASLC